MMHAFVMLGFTLVFHFAEPKTTVPLFFAGFHIFFIIWKVECYA